MLPLHMMRLLPMFTASLVAASALADSDDAWILRVGELRKQVANADHPLKESQKLFYQLSVDFPIHVDWVLQDHPSEAWKFLMPDQFDGVQDVLFSRHGVDSLPAYLSACEERREKRLRATLDRWAPFVFAEGTTHRMSFIGYTEGLSDARHERFFKPGSRLSVLDFAEGSTHGVSRQLIDDPHGMIRDVDVSFDRQKLLFSWKKSDRLDDYHIYEYQLADGSLRQLTRGIGRADYEPIYLPDGDIIFASTRPEQSVPCWWTEISNLYRMNGDGEFVRRLAIDQVHTLYPQLMHNGRVCYTRWDYNDRGQNYPHPVFEMDPDGKAQRVFYGGNSWFPTSLLHTRAIPGTHKAISIAAGHHTRQRGKLVIVDTQEGRDEGKGLHFIAPRREKAYERVDVAMQYGDQFRYPFAFSEDEFLVSYTPDYGFDPHQLEGVKQRYHFKDFEHYGLYWINADGERELLHRAADLGVLRPMPLGDRIQPPLIKERIDYTSKSASYYVHDVYRGIGLKGVERGEAKKIRVVRLNYRAAGVGKTHNRGEGGGSINSAPVGIANASWDIKEILGDADIHEDGSAFFEVPPMESIYLQVLDGKGRVLQTTRTWDTLRPGEQKSCMGCHDKSTPSFEGFTDVPTLAIKQGMQKLRPFYGESRGFSFNMEVQPILDQHCVKCHDGSKERLMDLTATPVKDASMNKRFWSKAYLNLTEATRDKNGNYTATPEQGIVTWISKMSRPTELAHSQGSVKSPLIHMLDDGHHDVKLSKEEYHKLVAWIDLLVPFCGTYREAGDWSEKDHDYYSYYETKRKAQASEEQAAVAAYLDAIAGKKSDPKPAADFTQATYRALPLNEWKPSGEGAWALMEGHEPSLIDRIEWDAGADCKIVVKGKELGNLESGMLVFDKPARSTDLRIQAGFLPSELQLHGVQIRELPEHEGFKRHLEFTH